MISNSTLEKLEYSKVLSYISNYSSTEKGKEQILNSHPFETYNEALTEGNYVSEAKNILINNEYPPFNYIPDLYEDLSKSTIPGTILSKESIKKILELAEVSRKLYTFIKNSSSEYMLFKDFQGNFFIDKNFESHISKIFNPAGEISDNASSKLKEIRKEIIKKSQNLKSVIEGILKGLKNSYLVQEEYVTQRDGRLVLPIKAEHKRHLKGFIHSESNTGQTVYIEPEATLELNNEILSLSFAEKREIEKILRDVTSLIGKKSNELKIAFHHITFLDVIFAKAKYSLEIIGSFPKINSFKKINIIEARHPLLLKKMGRDKTIPLNFKYENNDVTLITGPNAGGKTVVLKTIGLLSLMVQTGIHVPVHSDSEFYFFNKIMLDIGDEQSIEDDLSTFSSHLTNIKSIIDEADSNSLILIDEIGTGTDPSEGTALAASFLVELLKKHALVIASTHHGNLKLIASELDGFQNASMEYDVNKLEPTYKFRQGIPGSSYAFEVAQKIGLSSDLIKSAKSFLDTEKYKVENFIIDLENKSLELSKKLNQLEIENVRLKGLTSLYEKENKKLKKQKDAILKSAKLEAEQMLSDFNKRFESTIKNIKESKADKNVIKNEKNKIEIIKREADAIFNSSNEELIESKEFQIGDYVRIKDSLTSGEIVELDKLKANATIDTGLIRIKVKINSLEHSKKEKQKSTTDYSVPSPTVESNSLDLRGHRPEEIEFKVIRFIDDAHFAGLKDVEIIHGKGTGALRVAVHELLNNHQLVSNYELATEEYGGAGITKVTLK